jgi:Uma2 family endonuclease
MALTQVRHKVWTRDTYYRIADSGAFEGERVELIEGEVVYLSPQNYEHASTIGRMNAPLVLAFSPAYVVRVQLPLDLGNLSQPEPDFAVVLREENERSQPHPSRAVLLIEVSDSSLPFDRGDKASVYAKAGFPELWIVNLVDRQVEVFRDPGPDPALELGHRYHSLTVVKEGSISPLFAPQVAISLDSIFPISG